MEQTQLALTTEQAAKCLGLSKTWLEQLRCQNRGPVWVKVGTRVLYRPEDLAGWLAANWAKLSESSYAIDTSEDPDDVYARLTPFLDGDDQLYVITLSRPYYGQGSQKVNEWLEQHL